MRDEERGGGGSWVIHSQNVRTYTRHKRRVCVGVHAHARPALTNLKATPHTVWYVVFRTCEDRPEGKDEAPG
jgi:hypothetical protein